MEEPSWLCVRRARPEDAGAIMALTGELPPRSMLECALVAVSDQAGQVIGCLLAEPIAYDDARPLTLWVDALVVAPSFRRRGVARMLYCTLGDRARASGAKGILTRLPAEDNGALRLHQRVGFKPHAGDALLWRLD